MQLRFISTSVEKLAVQLTLESQTIANLSTFVQKLTYKEHSMRNVRKKRAQDKQNYLRNKESKRQASRNNYWKNPDKKRASTQAYSLTTFWKNLAKKRASSQASSYTRYWEDPETKRVSSHIHYWEDSDKGKAASRVSSPTSYWRNPGKKRAAARMTNLKAARAKLKWYRQYYAKHAKRNMCFQEKQVCIGRAKGFCNRSACEENTVPGIGQQWC